MYSRPVPECRRYSRLAGVKGKNIPPRQNIPPEIWHAVFNQKYTLGIFWASVNTYHRMYIS